MIPLPRPLFILALVAALSAPIHAADPRVGDAGSTPDADKFDSNWPDMKEWASAGVRGGIPARDAGKVVKTIKPGESIQTAIDETAKAGGGVVLLKPGAYTVKTRIDMADGVILRGESRDGVILENVMRHGKLTEEWFTVRFDGTKKAGLEDLTIRHADVAKLGLDKYHERIAGPVNPDAVKDLFIGGVEMERAEDCWIDNCYILHSGSHPLDVQGSHITVRDTLIDGAYNKGELGGPAGSGNVYFSVVRGLFYNNTVQHVRHCLVMRNHLAGGECKFNVILDCNFGGDVNFHGNRQDAGHNLFEGTFVRSPISHGWPAWSYWKREQIGPENIVYKSIGWGGHKDESFASTDAAKVYTFTGIRDPNILGEVAKATPKAGTLFAVKGARPTKPDAAGAWPKHAGEARDLMFKRMIKSPLTPGATPKAED